MEFPDGKPGQSAGMTVGALVFIGLCVAAINAPIGRSDTTDAPNVTAFRAGTLSCGGYIYSEGYIPAVRMQGALETKYPTLLLIKQTDPSAAERSVRNVWVNNVPQQPIKLSSSTEQAYLVPAWDGIAGHQPVLSAAVVNPATADDVSFWLARASDEQFDAWFAIGKASESTCTVTSNPQPAR